MPSRRAFLALLGSIIPTAAFPWTHGGTGGNFLVTDTGAFLVDQSGNNLVWS